MPSPFLYFADEKLSAAELSAARLDGHLVELGEAYIPADAVETRELRAGSLRGLLGDSLAATHVSAAWVHGALHDPPGRHTVQRAVPRRLHHVMGRRLLYRDQCVDRDDLVSISGVWVTSLVRTLADVARVSDDDHLAAAMRLAETFPGLVGEAIRWLERSGALPYKRPALVLLRSPALAGGSSGCSGQDDVTR